MTALILIVVFAILLIMGIPIAISMCGATFAGLLSGDISIVILAQKMINGMDSVTMLAVPGFLLAGELMCKGGLAKRLIDMADAFIGHIRNGLSIVTIVAGMFFSAMNGTAAATTAAIGELMIPEMNKRGYDKDYVSALTAVIGPLGPIIPPSVVMVIYAVGGGVSAGDLFMAGIIPGILLGVALVICSYIQTSKMELKVKEKTSIKEKLAKLKDGFWALLTPIIILGGIYGGICTPTEASVIAIFYSLFVGIVIYKELTWKDILECCKKALENSAMIMLIMGAASGFGWMVAVSNLANYIANGITGITTNYIILLLLMNIILIVIGCFMDTISAVVVFQAVLLPIAKVIGIDMLQFAAIFIVIISIGNATPPFGYSLFVASRISHTPLEKLFSRVMPMIAAMLIVVLLLDFIPVLTIGLPTLLK